MNKEGIESLKNIKFDKLSPVQCAVYLPLPGKLLLVSKNLKYDNKRISMKIYYWKISIINIYIYLNKRLWFALTL